MGDQRSGDDQEAAQRAEDFQRWLLDEHKVSLSELGLELRCSQSRGFGVFATRQLGPGSTLAEIPSAGILHAGRVRETAFGKQVLQLLARCALAPEELLWLYMIWGRAQPQESCPWRAYLRSLPLEDPLAALHGCAASAQWLSGTPLAEAAVAQLVEQRARHARLLAVLGDDGFPAAELFSFEAWLWARSCYVSRAFGWRAFPEGSLGDPGFQSDALCPFLDALNHNRKAQVEFVFSPHSAQILLASSAEGGYEAGDEVFMLYGAGLGNEGLLSRYGFSLPRNPHDRVEEVAFHLPPGTSPSAAAERLAALRAALPAVVATQAAPGLITVKLSEGLRRRVDETPVELLRAASLLASGRDYDDLEASCAEKRDAAKATAAALRGMLRGTAAGKAQPRSGLLLALRRRRRTRAVLQAALKSGQRKTSSRPPPPPPPPAAGATGRAAALYAWGRRRILRDAASCATTEAEMAQLAAQMHQGEGGEEQEAEEQSEQEGDE
ncbi:unnamed protein product [Polarella glacialis]|uniref:SET domain-containing protein n=2 Tax=Polarella glacialis TaxID=89957 RepID=A0A813FMF1_POLGL|nr:unnamed protein product [Polarella glacialis]